MTDRTKSQRWTIITQSSDPVASSRRRAAERVRQRLNRDKKQWNIYGKKPSRKPKSRTQSRIHSTPWNDRFIFDEDNELAKSANGAAATNLCNGSTKSNKETTDTNHKRIAEFNRIQPPLRKISSVSIDSQKINETQASGQSAGEVTGSIIRYYTERSDGEKVMEFQRHEIIPMPSPRSSKPNPSVSNLIGTCNVAVSPFDAAKVSAALEDYAVRNGHKKQYSSKVDLSNETNTALLSNVDYFDNQLTRLALTQGNEDHKFIANDYSYKNKVILDLQGLNTISLLEIIEEILYAMELEEDLVFQALVERKNAYFDEFNVSSLINVDSKISNNHSSDQSDFKECGDLHGEDQCNVLWQPMDEQCNEDMEEESVRRRRKDAIIQYITKERLFRDTAEMPLMQSAGLPFHEIIEMLSDSVVDSCINDIASELDSIIQNISHDICRII